MTREEALAKAAEQMPLHNWYGPCLDAYVSTLTAPPRDEPSWVGQDEQEAMLQGR